MAITYTLTLVNNWVMGSERAMLWQIKAPANSTYATGGDTISAASFGLDKIDFISFMIDGAAADGQALPAYDISGGTGKFKLYGTGSADDDLLREVDGQDVSGLIWYAMVYGVD